MPVPGERLGRRNDTGMVEAFTLPGGGSVQLEFTVNIPANVTAGTYQNPATTTYTDPTRTTAGGTTSASYNPASSTARRTRR